MNSTITPPAHTPGPWHIGESENAAVYNGETHWAILPNPQTTHGQVIADIETLPEALANARLIAAAPDLLAACKQALADLEVVHDRELKRKYGGNWGPLSRTVSQLSAAVRDAE